MIGFALDITTQAIVTFCVGALSGAGGFAGIKSYALRPKLRRRTYSIDLIRSRTPEQRQRLEKVLSDQQLPTAVTEVVWKNIGRRAARNIAVEVVIPGGILGYSMTPDSQSLVSPWNITENSTPNGYRIQLNQELLVPKTVCTLAIEHNRGDDLPAVTFLEGDREIPEGDLVSGRRTFDLLLAFTGGLMAVLVSYLVERFTR